ncbi:hypothetical protein Nepgr_016547 [Nepenthes gracilis]|uniref:Uncharacterized protein n=1 Tax=Nepenthes gracilis TaxID=150966 RepID=A0AAD3SQR4_NEPGR|nr:hypothetical protein Nepgr_016547 [Nepenthes gracilis]
MGRSKIWARVEISPNVSISSSDFFETQPVERSRRQTRTGILASSVSFRAFGVDELSGLLLPLTFVKFDCKTTSRLNMVFSRATEGLKRGGKLLLDYERRASTSAEGTTEEAKGWPTAMATAGGSEGEGCNLGY